MREVPIIDYVAAASLHILSSHRVLMHAEGILFYCESKTL